MGKISSISVVVSQGSVAVASVVFTTDFMDYVFCNHNIQSLCHQKHKFMGASLLISLAMVVIENLACFAYISFIAIMAILSSVVAIYYYDLQLVFNRDTPVPQYSMFKLSGISSFIGLSLFAMEVRHGLKPGNRHGVPDQSLHAGHQRLPLDLRDDHDVRVHHLLSLRLPQLPGRRP